MKKPRFYLSTLLMTVLAVSCNLQPQDEPEKLLREVYPTKKLNALSSAEKSNGWILLFDGSGPSGWRGYNMSQFPDCWMIEDQSLTMTTEGGGESQDIISEKSYRNFALSLEFRLSMGANSGIFWQVAEDTIYKYPYETAPEYQVIDHESWPDPLEDWQICGANYAMYPPISRPFKPVGEWNHAFILVNGNKVVQYLNGEKTVEYEKYSEEWNKLRNSGKWAAFPDYGKYDEGPIALQNHGTRVWYRNIKIREL